MGEQTGRKIEFAPPQKMGDAVQPQGVQAGVAAEHLQQTSGRRVFVKYGVDIFSQCFKHSLNMVLLVMMEFYHKRGKRPNIGF
jgi:hypothetical protein